jgi:hypothetical protein
MCFYWVKRKPRLKPAMFFIAGVKQRDFGRPHPVLVYLLPPAVKTHRISEPSFSEARRIRNHNWRRLDSADTTVNRRQLVRTKLWPGSTIPATLFNGLTFPFDAAGLKAATPQPQRLRNIPS